MLDLFSRIMASGEITRVDLGSLSSNQHVKAMRHITRLLQPVSIEWDICPASYLLFPNIHGCLAMSYKVDASHYAVPVAPIPPWTALPLIPGDGGDGACGISFDNIKSCLCC